MELKDLIVWQKARVFRNEISAFAKKLPSEEKYKLVDQIVRSSRSISANIAQGHGRFHYQENTQFCRIARGSLVENFDHLVVALDENYLSPPEYNRLVLLFEELKKLINGYIKYLQTRKNQG